ncbi:hypothetical protein MJN51_38585, partial [Salmonella enterica subsp. enterica serovar Kentucky]|nr:hypothetical protein [Salmonella enterica subsp. enterica serovar Kentucky]
GTTGTFADLLRLVAAIDGIDRIRFTTSHPIEFTDDIIEVYRDCPNFLRLFIKIRKKPSQISQIMNKINKYLMNPVTIMVNPIKS